MLTFVIPTHSRPHTIERCVRSIAEQIPSFAPVFIKVLAHNASDETHQILNKLQEEFPGILKWRPLVAPADYSAAFQAMFTEAEDSEWVWTFGDDDYLLPGALPFMLEELKKPSMADIQFLHVVEKTREANTKAIYRGRMIDLCNTYGWIEMTGFISGNIIRGDRLAHAAKTPRWRRYAKSAFVQSAALLEELRDDQCALLDIAVIDSQRNASEDNPDTMEKWNEQAISLRYQWAAEAIETMFDDGILFDKVTPRFYRYLSYSLINRFLSHFTADYLNHGIVYDDLTWNRLHKLAIFLNDEEEAKTIHEDINLVRGLTLLHSQWTAQLNQIAASIDKVRVRRNQFPYPYSYVEPKELEAPAVETPE